MISGHLSSGGEGLDWVCEEQPGWKKFLRIGNEDLSDFHGNLPGFQCRQCGLLVIQHEKLKGEQ